MSSSVGSPTPIHPCRWGWCKHVFDTADRLARHVFEDHVDNEIPIKREEIRLEMRAFDGTSAGEDTIRTSQLMNDNAFLHDEEKDPSILQNGHAVTVPDVVNGAAEEHRMDSVSETSPIAQEDAAADVPSPSHDNVNGHQSPETVRTPSPTTRSFGALSAASSPSPDPDDMAVATVPSLAEMIAKTINSTYSSDHEGEAGPSSAKPATDPGRPKPPSTGTTEEPRRSPATLGKRKSAEPPVGDAPRPPSRTSARSPLHPHRADRSRSHSAPAQDPSGFAQVATVTNLSPIPEAENDPQNELQQDARLLDSAPSTARRFRTGSIRLEPDPPPEEIVQSEPQNHVTAQSHPQPELQMRDAQPEGPSRPLGNTSSFIDDADMISSSLDPSIPAFTQAFDTQDQSQWPLATQAHYSFDSQSAFSSQ